MMKNKMRLRVLVVVGTRPEAIKMAPVILALQETPQVDVTVCATGQHREMLDQVLGLFNIQPDVDLNLMQRSQSLAELSAAIFTHLDRVIEQVKPEWLLVQGDTTTVMAASILAYYHHVRVGHIEAGLRTGDKWQPFPEEINRRIAGVLADAHFAPTQQARDNLLREGVDEGTVFVTGNTVIDAMKKISLLPQSAATRALFQRMDLDEKDIPQAPKLIVVTAHRRENFGQPIIDICTALKQLAADYGDRLRIVYPVHLNPNIKGPVHQMLDGLDNVFLIPPINYLTMIQLLKRATLVLTDSGGIQEEAPSLGVPVLVLRNTTERPEVVEAGAARMVGSKTVRILKETRRLLEDLGAVDSMKRAPEVFGDGHAAERIARLILDISKRNSGKQ